MKLTNFPQVLLLGNGLNRAFSASSWEELMVKICKNSEIDPTSDAFKNLPYPLQAVLTTMDQIDTTIKQEQALFYGAETIEELTPLIRQLLSANFDHILTTNYSYEIERAANSEVMRDGVYCKRLVRHTDVVSRAEAKYLLHTYNEVNYAEKDHKIWHIHGEARKPNSIILGHYYYGKLLAMYQKELDKRKNKQYFREKNGEAAIVDSWLDVFIMGDVYTLGFGFDFSEFDLWWLLNRKKRENATHGKLYFYSPETSKDVAKFGLLKSYGAKIINLGFRAENPDYRSFYEKAIQDIQRRVKFSRKKDTDV